MFLKTNKSLLLKHKNFRFSSRDPSTLLESKSSDFKNNFTTREGDVLDTKLSWNYLTSNATLERIRIKRGLKSTSSSRTLGLGHKSGSGSLSLRRGNKKTTYEETFEEEDTNKKKNKHKGPCEPLPDHPYYELEVIKYGREHNLSSSSGTVIKLICKNGYVSNLVGNKTAKCVRGKWRPEKPTCTNGKVHVFQSSLTDIECICPLTLCEIDKHKVINIHLLKIIDSGSVNNLLYLLF